MLDLFVSFVVSLFFSYRLANGNIFWVNKQENDASRRVISLEQHGRQSISLANHDMRPHFAKFLHSFVRKSNVSSLKRSCRVADE